VYAFCNVHDVVSKHEVADCILADHQSWGTKGSDKVSEDLGVVKSEGSNKDEVVVDVPIEQHDINAVYAGELKVLGTKAPKEVKVVAEDQKQEDYYKNFRTNASIASLSLPAP